jgi:hypothetical protein
MWLLIVAFVAGCVLVIALSEDESLEDKRWINRMADASRKGKPVAVRQRSRYIQAGLRTK